MSRTGRIISLVAVASAAAVGALFTVQNSTRTTDLSLDLFVVAYHLESPQPVPHLLWAAFGIGLLVGGTWGLMGRWGLRRDSGEQEASESQTAFNAADDDWT
jgi:hypothetical protein